MEEKEIEIMDELAKNPKKTQKLFMKVFNSFDGRCKQMALSDPGRPITDYCQKCQNKAKKILGGKYEF